MTRLKVVFLLMDFHLGSFVVLLFFPQFPNVSAKLWICCFVLLSMYNNVGPGYIFLTAPLLPLPTKPTTEKELGCGLEESWANCK